MKRALFLLLAAVLAAGLVLIGCSEDDGGGNTPEPPDYGTNLVTEAAILAATGLGGTTVTKVSGGYQVEGTITAFSNWDGSVNDSRIVLNIQADPADVEAYFAKANRIITEITFPNSAVKPIPVYTEGFQIYLENTKATANTAIWAGTWQKQRAEEYDAIGGVGKLSTNWDLKIDPLEPASISEVGDYQHLVLVLIFEDADAGKKYSFTINKAEVYGDSVSSEFPVVDEVPAIHESSSLEDAVYSVGDEAASIEVVATWTANKDNYTYAWFRGANDDYQGGWFSDGTMNWGTGGNYIVPDTSVAGVTYYFVKIEYLGASTLSRIVKITVN
jgi:hypothetical protein